MTAKPPLSGYRQFKTKLISDWYVRGMLGSLVPVAAEKVEQDEKDDDENGRDDGDDHHTRDATLVIYSSCGETRIESYTYIVHVEDMTSFLQSKKYTESRQSSYCSSTTQF